MARLVKVQNGEILEEFLLNKGNLTIGRALDNDVVLHDETVSSHHAIISLTDSTRHGAGTEFQVKDLKSTNKTYVNDKEISERKLNNKDVVRVGLSYFEFISDGDAADQTDFSKTTKLHKSWIPGVYYTKD